MIITTTNTLSQSDPHTKTFIEGNTIEISREEIHESHAIPVFVKDNIPAISHVEFIDTVSSAISDFYGVNEARLAVRVSHPIKGRIPSAKNKPVEELEEHERTIYYERVGFTFEIPEQTAQVGDNRVSMCVGGVKSYHLDNFHNCKGVDEHFKIFIGFQNRVCLNLCIQSDGIVDNLTARTVKELYIKVIELFTRYNSVKQIENMQLWSGLHLEEKEFAQLIGRCRLYNFLPNQEKLHILPLKLTDTQIGKVAEGFYRNSNFSATGSRINLWHLHNLFTESNKSSYMDTFIMRGANASDIVSHLSNCILHKEHSWFLS
jgi:hypothetical protein